LSLRFPSAFDGATLASVLTGAVVTIVLNLSQLAFLSVVGILAGSLATTFPPKLFRLAFVYFCFVVATVTFVWILLVAFALTAVGLRAYAVYPYFLFSDTYMNWVTVSVLVTALFVDAGTVSAA
jgi:hypothetical protein